MYAHISCKGLQRETRLVLKIDEPLTCHSIFEPYTSRYLGRITNDYSRPKVLKPEISSNRYGNTYRRDVWYGVFGHVCKVLTQWRAYFAICLPGFR